MAAVGYIRVSTLDQNTDRQLDGIKLDKIFTDKSSGATKDRPELMRMLDYVREGDVIHVHSIDRLGRSLIDLKEIVKSQLDKGVAVHFHKENMIFSTDSKNPMNELLFNILASFAEFERALIKERQLEGINKAKERGAYMGRKKTIDDAAIIEAMSQDGASFRKVAKALDISLSTVQRAMKKAAIDSNANS